MSIVQQPFGLFKKSLPFIKAIRISHCSHKFYGAGSSFGDLGPNSLSAAWQRLLFTHKLRMSFWKSYIVIKQAY